jgi:hypothetical protein
MKKIAKIGFILIAAAVTALVIKDFYDQAPIMDLESGRISLKWAVALTVLLISSILLYAFLYLSIWHKETVISIHNFIAEIRLRISPLRWLIAFSAVIVPIYILIYTFYGNIFSGAFIRFTILLIAVFFFSVSITSDKNRLVSWTNIFFSIVFIGFTFAVADYLKIVTNYPFSLTWSEGNRLYDYSIFFGKNRYLVLDNIEIPYSQPGRNILWGILFLIPDSPIWLHRLWDRVLWILPHIILGVLLARWGKYPRIKFWIIVLWVFLFMLQGPVYTPLILCAILVILFVRPGSWILSLIGVVLASYYAASSRYTWAPAPAIWTAMILLSEVQIKEEDGWKSILKRIIPIGLVCLAGLAAAVAAYPALIIPQEFTSDYPFSQSLLWFRLLPNATYEQGIVLGIISKTLPLMALLMWMAIQNKWRLNWLQKLSYLGLTSAFFLVGLVISVKIGGGNNLHNLDMYLVTLVILAGLMLKSVRNIKVSSLPEWIRGLLLLVIFLPIWNIYTIGSPVSMPKKEIVTEALEKTKTLVEQVKNSGDILFLDQRQLLTFGEIKGVPLISEYEKKLLMEQAMGDNFEYFQGFYSDLADKRFALIVSNPLSRTKQERSDSFSDENNKWVKWVARPVRCFYRPIYTSKEVRLELLVPRTSPKNCPEYIHPAE